MRSDEIAQMIMNHCRPKWPLAMERRSITMNTPFTFREASCDWAIYEAIVVGNEYRIPASFEPDDIILDIGTHIGSFSYAAILRGSRNVHTFEAFQENYECATRNLAPFAECVALHLCAVWRSDRRTDALFFREHRPDNKAAGHVLYKEGTEVEAVALDDILHRITANGRKRVRFLKIDCEGSEYAILLTTKRLDLVDEIAGEYHNFTTEHKPTHPFYAIPEKSRVDGYERYTIDELAGKLRTDGFSVITKEHPTIPTLAGWFFAERTGKSPKRSHWQRLKQRAACLFSM